MTPGPGDLHMVRPTDPERRIGTPASRMAARGGPGVAGLGAFVDQVQDLIAVLGGALTAIAEPGCRVLLDVPASRGGVSCLDDNPTDPTQWCHPCIALAAITITREWAIQ